MNIGERRLEMISKDIQIGTTYNLEGSLEHPINILSIGGIQDIIGHILNPLRTVMSTQSKYVGINTIDNFYITVPIEDIKSYDK